MARDGLMSPINAARPVVKFPAAGATPFQPAGGYLNAAGAAFQPAYALPAQPTFRGATNSIPMHQPRPQKAISVTTIERPHAEAFAAPHQQEQQPFHHQVPVHMNGQPAMHGRHLSMQSHASGNTPLSNIPEQAINAPAFQPMYAATPAVGASYGYGGMYMYSMPEMPAANGSWMMQAGSAPGNMYEAGGATMYYTDPNAQMAMDGQYAAMPGMEGYYYAAPMMYYPAA